MLALALAAALGAGLLASFVANELRPTFHDARALGAISERPILGSLSLGSTQETVRKKRLDLTVFVGGVAEEQVKSDLAGDVRG